MELMKIEVLYNNTKESYSGVKVSDDNNPNYKSQIFNSGIFEQDLNIAYLYVEKQGVEFYEDESVMEFMFLDDKSLQKKAVSMLKDEVDFSIDCKWDKINPHTYKGFVCTALLKEKTITSDVVFTNNVIEDYIAILAGCILVSNKIKNTENTKLFFKRFNNLASNAKYN